jgi:drug/metabolite transporter (DMT)-like permease
MKFSKDKVENYKLLAMVISVIGFMMIISFRFYLFGSVLVIIGFTALVISVRYLNSLPLTEEEIQTIKSAHDRGKYFTIFQTIFFGLFLFIFHIVVETIESFWFDTPLSENFNFIDIFVSLVFFVIVPIIAGYTIWKTNEETYQKLEAKND